MDPCVDIVTVSGEVSDSNSSVILVAVRSKCLSIRCAVALYNEWVSDHAVACLETNLRLEGLRIDAAEHLEGYIWAVEETTVIRGRTLVTCNVVVGVRNVSGIRINEDLNSAVHCTD